MMKLVRTKARGEGRAPYRLMNLYEWPWQEVKRVADLAGYGVSAVLSVWVSLIFGHDARELYGDEPVTAIAEATAKVLYGAGDGEEKEE